MFTKLLIALAVATGAFVATASAAVLQVSFTETITDANAAGPNGADAVPAGFSGADGLDTFTDDATLTFDTDGLVRSGDTYSGSVNLTYGAFSATDAFTLTLRSFSINGVDLVEIVFDLPTFTSGDLGIALNGVENSLAEARGVFDRDDLATLASLGSFALSFDFFAFSNNVPFGTDSFGERTVQFEEVGAVPVPAAAFLLAPALAGGLVLRRRVSSVSA